MRRGGRLLLTQDDDDTLFWLDVDVAPPGTESLPLREDAGAMTKAEKRDFEAVLPSEHGLRLFHRGNSGHGGAKVDLIIDPARPHEATVAAAQDTPDAIDDGPIASSANGLLTDSGGRGTPIRKQDGSVSIRKFEGLVVDSDLTGAWLVTHPDDEHLTAELCRLELTGPA